MNDVKRRGFRATRGGLQLRIEPGERAVMRDLLAQLAAFVAPEEAPQTDDPLARLVGIAPQAERPRDPALLRLLPDAYADDPAAAEDFRRFTEHGLREQKSANARLAAATLQRGADGEAIRMSQQEGQAWLLALNDLRLALAVRLGITDDQDEGREPLYDWLTWLQATLVDALMP